MTANDANGEKSSGRKRTALVAAALVLALLVGGWLLWQSILGSFSSSESTLIQLPPDLAQVLAQNYWQPAVVSIEGKGEVQIGAGYSTATVLPRVPACALEVRRTLGALDLQFGYRLQNPQYSFTDRRLMGLAVAVAYDPAMQVADDLRQKLRGALPGYLSDPRGTIDQVEDDAQNTWLKFAVAKNDADRRAAADKLLTMVAAWRDQWLAAHKDDDAAALVKVRAVIAPEQEQALLDEWNALQRSRNPMGNRLPGWLRNVLPGAPATQPTTRPTHRAHTRPTG